LSAAASPCLILPFSLSAALKGKKKPQNNCDTKGMLYSLFPLVPLFLEGANTPYPAVV